MIRLTLHLLYVRHVIVNRGWCSGLRAVHADIHFDHLADRRGWGRMIWRRKAVSAQQQCVYVLLAAVSLGG